MSYLTSVDFKTILRFSGIGNYRDNAESRHKMIMSLFPQKLTPGLERTSEKILFRGEDLQHGPRFLIRSSTAPANLPGVETVIEPPINQVVKSGDNVIFRVTVSPIKRRGSKERFLTIPGEVEEWLQEKLAPALENVEIIQQKEETIMRDRFRKNFINLAQLDGVATVKNIEVLEELLVNGVGRNKSYGAGLLTIRKI